MYFKTQYHSLQNFHRCQPLPIYNSSRAHLLQFSEKLSGYFPILRWSFLHPYTYVITNISLTYPPTGRVANLWWSFLDLGKVRRRSPVSQDLPWVFKECRVYLWQQILKLAVTTMSIFSKKIWRSSTSWGTFIHSSFQCRARPSEIEAFLVSFHLSTRTRHTTPAPQGTQTMGSPGRNHPISCLS